MTNNLSNETIVREKTEEETKKRRVDREQRDQEEK
jgi:hypothetical protein